MRTPFLVLTVALLPVVATVPARAVRIFLDADDDGNPETYRNLVDGPLETPVTIVVSLDEGDSGLTRVDFMIEWDCSAADASCWLGMPHGDIGWSLLPDTFPFSQIGMMSCTGLGCNCTATRFFGAQVDAPQPGTWVFGTLPFTREGMGAGCDPLVYPGVEFRLLCSSCDYAPGDEVFTRMVLTGDSDATSAPHGDATVSWGRTKASYR